MKSIKSSLLTVILTAGLVIGIKSDANAYVEEEGSYWKGLCQYTYTLTSSYDIMCKSCIYDFQFKNGKIWGSSCVTIRH